MPAVRGAVAILAGGQGRRLGMAKALAPLGGRPLISYPLAAAEEARLEPMVVAKPGSELPELDVRVVREPAEPRHPLLGVVTALEVAEHEPVVVVGCDMPFADGKLLAWLASFPDPLVVPRSGGRLQPLLARYSDAVLPELRAALDRNEPLREAVAALDPLIVPEEDLARFGDPARLTFNVNTPEDLEAAEQTVTVLQR